MKIPVSKAKIALEGVEGVHCAGVQRYGGRDALYVRFAGSERRSLSVRSDANGFVCVYEIMRQIKPFVPSTAVLAFSTEAARYAPATV